MRTVPTLKDPVIAGRVTGADHGWAGVSPYQKEILMPTYIIAVAERRTYEIEADSEAAALERAAAEPEELPIGSLISVVRGRPAIVRAARDHSDEDAAVDEDDPHSGTRDIDQARLAQPWG